MHGNDNGYRRWECSNVSITLPRLHRPGCLHSKIVLAMLFMCARGSHYETFLDLPMSRCKIAQFKHSRSLHRSVTVKVYPPMYGGLSRNQFRQGNHSVAMSKPHLELCSVPENDE